VAAASAARFRFLAWSIRGVKEKPFNLDRCASPLLKKLSPKNHMSDGQPPEQTPGEGIAWKLQDQDIKTTRLTRRTLPLLSLDILFLGAGGVLRGLPAKPANKQSDAR
jgi:hypothetical protein